MPKVIIIGGGASGIFSAIIAKQNNPNSEILILEKANKVLGKVKVSGGGRCNVTNACFDNKLLVGNYPRGKKELYSPFNQFNTTDIIDWFKKKGVKLKTEKDGRIFPVSNNSQTIIDCLLKECEKLNIVIKTGIKVDEIQFNNNFNIITNKEKLTADRIIIAIGGKTNLDHYKFLENTKHTIIKPVPSLFTFNIPKFKLKDLAGTSFQNAKVNIIETKDNFQGPLLITHWGFSGPVILKLSAWAARSLFEKNYQFKITINWLNFENEDIVRDILNNHKERSNKKKITNDIPFDFTQRFWHKLLSITEISLEKKWIEISKKELNRLVKNIIRFEFNIRGTTKFKEEFVTCGGIKLSEINLKTMESKLVKGLFFVGEVLNIDGITGGFNFQNAWTTGYIAGKNTLK